MRETRWLTAPLSPPNPSRQVQRLREVRGGRKSPTIRAKLQPPESILFTCSQEKLETKAVSERNERKPKNYYYPAI